MTLTVTPGQPPHSVLFKVAQYTNVSALSWSPACGCQQVLAVSQLAAAFAYLHTNLYTSIILYTSIVYIYTSIPMPGTVHSRPRRLRTRKGRGPLPPKRAKGGGVLSNPLICKTAFTGILICTWAHLGCIGSYTACWSRLI